MNKVVRSFWQLQPENENQNIRFAKNFIKSELSVITLMEKIRPVFFVESDLNF